MLFFCLIWSVTENFTHIFIWFTELFISSNSGSFSKSQYLTADFLNHFLGLFNCLCLFFRTCQIPYNHSFKFFIGNFSSFPFSQSDTRVLLCFFMVVILTCLFIIPVYTIWPKEVLIWNLHSKNYKMLVKEIEEDREKKKNQPERHLMSMNCKN